MNVRSASIALITPDRQVAVADPAGDIRAETFGADPRLLYGNWRGGPQTRTNHAWPTWSPDGRYLAVFETDETGSSVVTALEVGRSSAVTVATLERRLPIYLFWSPTGNDLAILSQHVEGRGDRLHLAVCRANLPGSTVTLAEGTPLFFTWARDRVAAFVGDHDGKDARVLLLPANGAGRITRMPGRPGNFCAPVWLADRLVYVIQQGSRAYIVTASPEDAEPSVVEELRGLVALVRSPDGTKIARAVAPRGDGSPYSHLAIQDFSGEPALVLGDHACLAFFWMPDSSGLVTARVDTARNLMIWDRVGLDGTATRIAEAYPTRDLGFYLRFFEQYGQSHSLIDPDARNLLLSGGLAGHGDPHRSQRVWEVPLGGGEPRIVAEGLFAVYGPRPAAPVSS